MSVDSTTLFAILVMALATYATRVAGMLVLRFVTLTPRVQAGLEALPVAVLTAVITPVLFLTGPAETIAGAITALAAFRLPLLGTLVVGAAAILLMRAILG
ncbi:putative membrane protein [Rhodoligotrophos appendicifer]|uniref:AzlD family protein n=1 Tax=Rhodoligotrophos appendicifer TaxID=987056 RepID=UPI0011856370|nr:AzlD domain-containing protein [Rhodoligotrophos appendicifer]